MTAYMNLLPLHSFIQFLMSKLRVEDVFSSSSDEGDDVGARSNDEEEDVVNPLPTISHKRTLSFEDHDLPSTSASVVDSAQKKKQRKCVNYQYW